MTIKNNWLSSDNCPVQEMFKADCLGGGGRESYGTPNNKKIPLNIFLNLSSVLAKILTGHKLDWTYPWQTYHIPIFNIINAYCILDYISWKEY